MACNRHRRDVMINYQIERLDFSNPVDMRNLVDLQNIVYKGKIVFDEKSFKSWYIDNPNGSVISYNAMYGSVMVAHYAIVPVKMEIDGRVASGLLSMSTVTHPEHRGRGLFKQLAKMSYDYAAQNDYEFVIGVANANSYPGFLKYLDFKDIGMLDVLIGSDKRIKESSPKVFRTHWDEETIQWRLGMGDYFKDGSAIYGTYPMWKFKKTPFLHTFMGRIPNELIQDLDIPRASCWNPINLYVGIGSNARELGYRDMPKFIKRSPFHLIFLDLTKGKLPQMTKDNVLFQLLDFDVA